jgi:hypothetical protein
MTIQKRRKHLIEAVLMMTFIGCAQVRADVLESWNNPSDATFDGWSVPPKYSTDNYANFTGGYSTYIGVTNGAAALAVSATSAGQATQSGPDYSQMLASSYNYNWTKILAHAAGLQIDVYTPTGSFGHYLQLDVDLDNADAGYHSIYNFYFMDTNIGSETTLRYYFTPPEGLAGTLFADAKPDSQTFYNSVVSQNAVYQAALARSPNPTGIFIEVGGGYTTGQETMYVDNLSAFYQLGDFNFDHHVDAKDIVAMEVALENVNGYESVNSLTNHDLMQISDINGDGKFNNADLQALVNLLKAGGGSLDAVPEPSSLLLLALAIGISFISRRRPALNDRIVIRKPTNRMVPSGIFLWGRL